MAMKSVGIKTIAAKMKAAPQKESEAPEKEAPETPDGPLPLLDLSDAAVKKMIKQAKKRGYVTYEQLNSVMPSEEVTSEQIEDVLAMMSEMGINVVETEEAEADEEGEAREEPEEEESRGGELVEVTAEAAGEIRGEGAGRAHRRSGADVSARDGLGGTALREGEIAIAKRIEAGREAMIAGLCESPLTFQAIIIWRDELNEGKVFLRDIIDLEATYAGPDAKHAGPRRSGRCRDSRRRSRGSRRLHIAAAADRAPPSAPPGATPFKPRRPSRRRRGGMARSRRKATPTSTRTISRIRCRSPPSRPSSSPRCSRRSTTSPTPSSGCAACRTRTSRTS